MSGWYHLLQRRETKSTVPPAGRTPVSASPPDPRDRPGSLAVKELVSSTAPYPYPAGGVTQRRCAAGPCSVRDLCSIC